MFNKITLAVGFGAGYVLGAKAGTERYEQIVAKARELAGMPAVKNATSTVQDTAGNLADKAKSTVNDKVSQVSGSNGGGSDTGASATGTGATTRSTASAGAAPSATAPTVRP